MLERILVVDDESDACFVLKEVLSEGGFVVDSYKDPLLALSNFKAHSLVVTNYSLVILDIRMPGLNGFALYREIRKLDKRVKICFLTAGEMYYGYSDILSSVPAKYFIRKPIDNEELLPSQGTNSSSTNPLSLNSIFKQVQFQMAIDILQRL